MAIITLTSDWGHKDHYLSVVKAAILSRMPQVTIVDISHEIPRYDLNQTAFILGNSWHAFPKGSVHIIGVLTDASIETPHTAAEYEGHYFIGADNGIFSLLFSQPPTKAVEIDILQDSEYFTFSTRDVFVKAAIHLAAGKPIENLGDEREKLTPKEHFNPVVKPDSITGKIIYIDNYENLFSNITKELFYQAGKGRPFIIEFNSSRYKINKISHSYSDGIECEVVALFSTTGLLEIALTRANASGLLGIKLDDTIKIQFKD
jgi:S-adenosylmethionine hydrolase